MIYSVYLLKDQSRPGCAGLVRTLADKQTNITNLGLTTIGVFTPLFGLASNEVYLVVAGSGDLQQLPNAHDIAIVEQHRFTSTTRPVEHTPSSRQGVYVFRWFFIKPNAAQDIVRLSGEAWPSFEAEFDTEIQGLFVEDTPSPEKMLLLTWYRDLSVWQASRHPQPAARENFLKRHQLTTSATPIATSLAVNDGSSPLISHT